MDSNHWTIVYRLAVVGILIYIGTRLNLLIDLTRVLIEGLWNIILKLSGALIQEGLSTFFVEFLIEL